MFFEKLKNYNVLLASGSKRRHELLNQLGVEFKIINQEIEESFSNELKCSEITDYLAKKKSSLLIKSLKKNDLLITSDTIVWHKNRALGKPKNRDEAFEMIKSLENSSHEVITSICISTIKSQVIVNEKTLVFFDNIDKNDLLYYTKTSDVLDRAGSYGIQDYIGHIGIKKIQGSYSNVLGFPTNLFVNTINSMNL
ncbi:Maf family nucleotide pyrophosphatase [Flavobacteriaceae bacterium]|jgi:septum formation protein|nr:Maf family nucleotide pyrophosphatase [Flavobacteriaceae bacterium]MDB0068812.1 Maf family nucleotide pyrophosphatase [Flavobacteriaceae bacterium]MDB4092892.1 Maf family nucleotide pyrophosphatase [Flavobacteriaceae bacterium]MDB4164429.1 Maf family nucleotide pyrophosphatase [Flavobacteriaceae bacterium]MDC1337528.1 Maf family nucleotide pyrophosphatase [Flavobacteriaceae bacterium]|tara:strand:+ start:235 stop:822 length:588 start_codon:yes stop_codon:yes gene_type:complete